MAAATRFLASAVVGSLLVVSGTAQAGTEVRSGLLPADKNAARSIGSLSGVVRDERGAPIAGVVVSALGSTTIVAVTDGDGRFEFKQLPSGPYILRAHQSGYLASRSQTVQVGGIVPATFAITLKRASASAVLTASVAGLGEPVAIEPAATPDPEPADGENAGSEITWRLRHARRAILKDATIPTAILAEDSDPDDLFGADFAGVDVLGRTIGSRPRFGAGLFADTPFSGQVNLLTASSFNSPQQLFSMETGARSIAYARLGAPVGDNADWMVRGAITQSDIASWTVAGSYVTRPSDDGHHFNVGLAYSTQRYDGGNLLTLRDLAEGSRNAGAVYGYDTFRLFPAATVTYGIAYARYDYLDEPNLFSPRVELAVTPATGLRIKASASRTALAPGAEEFAPPNDTGIWLPPQRTFSSVEPGRGFSAEQSTRLSLAIEKDLSASTGLGIRLFRERVDDQLATIFGTDVPGQPASQLGHYVVGTVGDARASGYTASVHTEVARRVRCSLEYTSAVARLTPADNLRYLLLVAPSTVRPSSERLHDFSTTVETEVPETATRVLVLYRIGDGYARPGDGEAGLFSRVDGRFDVQIRQSLPFMSFSSARWEMLLAVRNFFRQDGTDQSVYDELLVVRPPKRVVGGVTLRF